MDEAHLLEWTIELPDSASLDAVSENLRRAGGPAQRVAAAETSVLLTHDPWGTHIRLRAATRV